MNKKNEKINAILDMVKDVVENPDKYPDRFMPIPLTNTEMFGIFTRRRVELIRLIKRKKKITVSKLAELTKRNVMGVIRDISILRKLHVVSAERKGKEVILSIKQDFLVIPIIEPLSFKEIESRKQLAVA